LKWNKTASAAIEQIKNIQYIESLKGYSGEVVLVGLIMMLEEMEMASLRSMCAGLRG
jgi:predicted subunit of tRNA(5-methylaminomethyl-2-thiouridylate) methyltransferase